MSSLMLSTIRLKKHDTVLPKPVQKTEEHSILPTHSAEFILPLHPDRETCVGEEGRREGKEMGLGKTKHLGVNVPDKPRSRSPCLETITLGLFFHIITGARSLHHQLPNHTLSLRDSCVSHLLKAPLTKPVRVLNLK